ncbi:MAG: TrkA family potassium uptake protein [Lactobacillales bacterium]|jgi:trk system potassium uptake protein TrkA|nr:TrkA family potassium uptake protein [Lactobacillales bacterium]
MKKTFAIIGLGRFGGSMCETLIDADQEVLVIDSDEERINEYMNIATHAMIANASEENTLKSIGMRNFDCVVVAIGEDVQASIMVSLMLVDLGVKYIVAKAKNKNHARILEKIGVQKVVHPERDMGVRTAKELATNNVHEFIEITPDLSFAQIHIVNKKLVNRTLDELQIRQKYRLNVVGVKHGDAEFEWPEGTTIVRPDDFLYVAGRNNDIERFDDEVNK